jgi:hypothetical protein
VGRLHGDVCNVATHLLTGVRVQVKLRKAKPQLYLMNKENDLKVRFRFLDAHLLVKRVKANTAILDAHNTALSAGREVYLVETRTQDFHVRCRFADVIYR